MVTVQAENAYDDFCQDAIFLCLDVDGGLVGLLRDTVPMNRWTTGSEKRVLSQAKRHRR